MPRTATAGAGDNMTGYAWSDTIGWISFNNLNVGDAVDYGVNIDASGNFSGYAWSDNIGWVSFNSSELTGCPGGYGACAPHLDWTTGAVSGWARACAGTANGNCSTSTSRTDGWDGWILLGGFPGDLAVDITTGDFSGYAWGSDVVGWISFSSINEGDPVGYGVKVGALPTPFVTLTASPNPVDHGNITTLTWNSNASSCTATSGTSGWAGSRSGSGSWTSGTLTADATYVITCDNGASDSESVTVQSVCGDGVISGTEQCDGSGGQCTTLGGYVSGTYTCTASCTRDESACVVAPPSCSDGIDNDGDGYADFSGVDSNGDGDTTDAADMPVDPGCSSATDTNEFNIGSIRPA